MSSYKYCIVPMCTNTTKTAPEKYFFDVPRDTVERKRWCDAMRRDENKNPPLSSKTHRHVCQDHFDLENDTDNFMRYRLQGGRMKLKKGIMPHLFDCQKSKRSADGTAERAAKRERKKTVSDLIQNYEANTPDEIFPVDVSDTDIPNDSTGANNQEKAIQVRIHTPYRSKATSTTPIESCDFQCQTKPLTQDVACGESRINKKFCNEESLSSDNESEVDIDNDSDYVYKDISSSDYEPDEEEEDEEWRKNMRLCMVKSVQKKSFMCLGIPDNAAFLIQFLALKSKCSTINVMITLKKLRMNETYENLGMLFGMSTSNVSRIFKDTLFSLASVLQNFVIWPADSVSIKYCLPIAFRKRYSDVQSIIDCFEIPIQKPSNSLHQSLSWSEYYKDNTIKYLISCTPDGTVSFISKGYGGRATDAAIVEDSGYLECLFPNLKVMADRGFKNIAFLLEKKHCKLVRPPSVSKDIPMTADEVKETKRIGAVRVHVERVIGRLRNFSILSKHTCVENHLIQLFDYVLITVCGLVNLQSKIIKR